MKSGAMSILRAQGAPLLLRDGRTAFNSLRFEDRGQRDFYALRCGAQLGANKFALADADGSRLLRNRIDGYGRVPVRHRAVRPSRNSNGAPCARKIDIAPDFIHTRLQSDAERELLPRSRFNGLRTHLRKQHRPEGRCS
jgi:hypothetical protein